jgi:hypothetical protein
MLGAASIPHKFESMLLMAILALGASGCSTLTQRLYVCGKPSAPHVEILRGTGGIFPGARDFQKAFAARGIASTMSYSEQWSKVADRIVARRESGDCSPIVLVGYSLGATASIQIARKLQERGIDVDAIIILEGYHHLLIPGNVHYCFNAYKLEGLPHLHGLPVSGECDSTVIDNYDLIANDPSGHMEELRHLTFTYDSCVHELLANKIHVAFNSATCVR